ncbi:MAG: tetratricopeptide repeat protein [Acidimicrobiales bacterium]
MDEWVRADEPRTPTTRSATTRSATTRSATDRPPRRAPTAGPATEPTLPADVATEIRRTADAATARHKEVLVERMGEAVASYDRHRYQDALRLGKQVAKEVPTVAAVRRLAGFAAYRLGRWREAIRHLEAYGELAGEVDHVPSLMDCQRALGHPRKVADLWNDLRRRSPDPDVLTEGRIVAVSTLADRGKLGDAIALLTAAGAARALRNPSERHLRQWYVLGDLYERAGDVPQACELFGRVQRAEPEAYDVTVRLEALGRSSGSRRGRARR